MTDDDPYRPPDVERRSDRTSALRVAIFAVLIASLCALACAGIGLMQLGSSGDFVGFSFHFNDGEPFFDVPMISTRTLFGAGVAILFGSLMLLTFVLVAFRVRK